MKSLSGCHFGTRRVDKERIDKELDTVAELDPIEDLIAATSELEYVDSLSYEEIEEIQQGE